MEKAAGNEQELFDEQSTPLPEPLDAAEKPSVEELRRSMDVRELDAMAGWFWLVGHARNISPLHHQKVLLRTIVPAERARLHLVWFERTIYVKPLPDCLLSHAYVCDILSPDARAAAAAAAAAVDKDGDDDDDGDALREWLRGFLHTYCELVISPLDLALAHELRLISRDVDWVAWHRFRGSVTSASRAAPVAGRYSFRELRLARLNLVYRLTGRGMVYFSVHREYGTYFQQYFTTFITTFAIVATVLAAMQVLIGIDGVQQAEVVRVSYWFSIVSLVVIVTCILPIIVLFALMALWNLARTVKFVLSSRAR